MSDITTRVRQAIHNESAALAPQTSALIEAARAAVEEIERLRLWIAAIGSLPDVDAGNCAWMAAHALNGRQPPERNV